MKVKRIIYIALGWLFIFFQAVSYLATLGKHEQTVEEHDVGYMIGYNFMMVLASIFFLMAYRLKRKIRRQKELLQIDSFLV